LKNILDSLEEVPDRRLEASHITRENYLSQVKNLKQHPHPQAHGPKKPRITGRRSWVSRFAAISAVMLIFLSGLGGTVYAAQASGPDDILYGIKTLTEEIQLGLESDLEDKLDLYISFASRRLQEIQDQIDAGQEVSEKALALLDKYTQKMIEQAAKLDEKGLNKALLQIEENLRKQNQMMTELGKEHPQGGSPDLLNSQEKIRERIDLVGNGKDKPQEFKDKVNEQKEITNNPEEGNKDENNNSDKPRTTPEQKNNNNSGNGSGNK